MYIDKNIYHNNSEIFDAKYPISTCMLMVENGDIDDIDFNLLNLSSFYRERRLLIDNLAIDTKLGNLSSYGWINIGASKNKINHLDSDELNLIINFTNFDISTLNRYIPWRFESQGFLSGLVEITGPVIKPKILSEIKVVKPKFDKIIGDNLYGGGSNKIKSF